MGCQVGKALDGEVDNLCGREPGLEGGIMKIGDEIPDIVVLGTASPSGPAFRSVVDPRGHRCREGRWLRIGQSVGQGI